DLGTSGIGRAFMSMCGDGEKQVNTREEFECLLPDPKPETRAAAMQRIHENRRTEIALYWTRSTHFWTISSVALTGYFAAEGRLEPDLVLAVSCLGLLFSVAWYCVNRGSQMFQLNCDLQLVLLEDGAAFPSQATKLNRHAFRWLRFGPYGYSVVRVNEILSCA